LVKHRLSDNVGGVSVLVSPGLPRHPPSTAPIATLPTVVQTTHRPCPLASMPTRTV